jgi:hypothetical protein
MRASYFENYFMSLKRGTFLINQVFPSYITNFCNIQGGLAFLVSNARENNAAFRPIRFTVSNANLGVKRYAWIGREQAKFHSSHFRIQIPFSVILFSEGSMYLHIAILNTKQLRECVNDERTQGA